MIDTEPGWPTPDVNQTIPDAAVPEIKTTPQEGTLFGIEIERAMEFIESFSLNAIEAAALLSLLRSHYSVSTQKVGFWEELQGLAVLAISKINLEEYYKQQLDPVQNPFQPLDEPTSGATGGESIIRPPVEPLDPRGNMSILDAPSYTQRLKNFFLSR